ncbi:MAG: nitroreductase family protein [Candidatus Shapirobacteria bacterium]|nr:nitroreductase family protein [Candidatus Shapirobacteria bacterium]MDD5073974.1 nitroreductase family protein [Candidatus Shapirobacteria bacterium]MDD5481597.1 nitroreductase family protein [Candidatus Shapirobacteria bacterium]
MNKVAEVIRKRRSVRAYQDRPVEEEKIEAILKAAQFAPSANHKNPWRFWVVRNKEVLNQLSQATPWGSFIAQAPLAIVVCADEALSREWLEDAAISGAHIYLEAVNQGLGTCWVQNRDSKTNRGESSEAYIKNILDIPDNFRVIATFPIGYPAEKKPPHSDQDYEKDKVHFIE